MVSARIKVMRNAHFAGNSALERCVEDAEPAAQILLDRQLRLELRLELELLGVVALLPRPGRHEGPEGTPLVAVDPVDGVLAALELEDRCEQLRAEPLLLQPLGDGVNGRDLILE